MNPVKMEFSRHQSAPRSYFPTREKLFPVPPDSTPRTLPFPYPSERIHLMSQAIRHARNALVVAALLYKELAISATDLLRPETYHR